MRLQIDLSKHVNILIRGIWNEEKKMQKLCSGRNGYGLYQFRNQKNFASTPFASELMIQKLSGHVLVLLAVNLH